MLYALQLVNVALALLMWLVLGRAALGILAGGRENLVTQFFVRFTDPVHSLTRRLLPFASGRWVPLMSLLLLGVLRVLIVALARTVQG